MILIPLPFPDIFSTIFLSHFFHLDNPVSSCAYLPFFRDSLDWRGDGAIPDPAGILFIGKPSFRRGGSLRPARLKRPAGVGAGVPLLPLSDPLCSGGQGSHDHRRPHPFASRFRRQKSPLFFRRDEAFRLLYENEKARLARPEDLLEIMDREGVHRSVICGFPWEDPALCREGNDFLWECQARHPGRFLPLACFSLRSLREAEKERDRCLTKGFAGIGELAFYRGGLSSEKIRRLTCRLEPPNGKRGPGSPAHP